MATASDAPASSTITTATDDAEVERDQGNGNGAVSAAPAAVGKEAAAEEEEMIGPAPVPPRPRKKRPLQFEQAFLDALPSAAMYEKSYMHRDVVTHVAVSPADYFITGSADGHLKFWKKKPAGIEFAKHFRSHLSPIEGLAVSVQILILTSLIQGKHLHLQYILVYLSC